MGVLSATIIDFVGGLTISGGNPTWGKAEATKARKARFVPEKEHGSPVFA
jgi:hypothetical protein